jgi:hypothetical protein
MNTDLPQLLRDLAPGSDSPLHAAAIEIERLRLKVDSHERALVKVFECTTLGQAAHEIARTALHP